MTRELAEPLLEDSPEADVLRFANRLRMRTYITLYLALYIAVLWFVVYPWAVGAAGTTCALLLTAAAVLVPCVAAVHRAVSVRRSLWHVGWARVSVQPAPAESVPPAEAKQEGIFARVWAEGVRRYRGEPSGGDGAHSVADLEAAAPDASTDFVERELVIDAPPSTVFDAMIDFDSLPQWANGINEVVDETPPGSSTRLIRFNSGVMGINVDYTLAYTLVRPTRVSWVSVAGAVKRIVGEYRLTPVDAASTRVNYRLEVDAGFSIPGPVRRAVNGLVVGAALPALKRHVESKAHARRPPGLASEHKAALAQLRKAPAELPSPGWVKCRGGGFVRAPVPSSPPPTTPPPSPPPLPPPPSPGADVDPTTLV